MHQATPACTIEYRVDKPIVKCLDTYRKVIGKNGNPQKPLNNPHIVLIKKRWSYIFFIT